MELIQNSDSVFLEDGSSVSAALHNISNYINKWFADVFDQMVADLPIFTAPHKVLSYLLVHLRQQLVKSMLLLILFHRDIKVTGNIYNLSKDTQLLSGGVRILFHSLSSVRLYHLASDNFT